jgi:hypothetical protein
LIWIPSVNPIFLTLPKRLDFRFLERECSLQHLFTRDKSLGISVGGVLPSPMMIRMRIVPSLDEVSSAVLTVKRVAPCSRCSPGCGCSVVPARAAGS